MIKIAIVVACCGLLLAAAITASADSRLANISTRGFVGPGDNTLIAGGILSGDASRAIVVRALGPSLTQVPGCPASYPIPISRYTTQMAT